ncbi:cyclophilin-like fold protein [Hyphomicrobium sp.]|uniref:cyclophilin-like fold protein n=1 Tax=Hyphomicrobium sp. TaxID=82 RepID=UPI0025BC8B74|nr:cyclophilin-like fold protein [Hyphomicrobium sp.]MCC7252366.1 MFS transporter [Hyphomicrobium sp.]
MTVADTRISRRTLLMIIASLALPLPASAQPHTPDRKGNPMRLRFVFADQEFTATLEDNPSAHDLFSMLPLDLKISDYSTNEKIAYLPRKLTEEGSGRVRGEAVGDLCYYAPWGNLAMFHGPYTWSRGLIRLGRLDHGAKPLLVRGEHPLRVEAL